MGLMLTLSGPKVLEFNCRFGDPEVQAILPLLDVDVADLLLRCAEGRFDRETITVHPGAAVCVVLAAAGYPERPRAGDPIDGIEAALAAGRTRLSGRDRRSRRPTHDERRPRPLRGGDGR